MKEVTLVNRRWTSVAAAADALVIGTMLLLTALLVFATAARAADSPAGRPDATVDLTTADGVRAIGGPWRYHDTTISEVAFRSVGSDLKPSGPPNRTYDYAPHAGVARFDDSGWEALDPATLIARRSTGKLCFAWYRLHITVPKSIGEFDPTGSTLVFETVVDDYAEVWVDGKLTRELGQRGGSVVGGWNAPNRLVIGTGLKPGQEIELAIFAINGPISAAPENYIWMRSARLDFYRALPVAGPLASAPAEVERRDAALDALVPRDARIEKLADGFAFTEGPIWTREGELLFSDPNTNVIYQWSAERGVTVFRTSSGFEGDISEYHQPGSNGLTLDPEGRLTVCQHGNRRVIRIESDGKETVLADRYEGKRLNSPNDLVYRSDGTLYFTDPPFGLPKVYDDPHKELPYSGVFCLARGTLKLVSIDLQGPNGLAFSPDEKYLYVDDWDEQKKVVMRYEVRPDGALANGKVFFDMTSAPGEEALDGLKVDRRGNLYVSGPGGVWIISPTGKHLGTMRGPELPANFAWGDADGRGLYMTARTGLYRVRLGVAGIRPAPLGVAATMSSN
jgi:gluconolactonase